MWPDRVSNPGPPTYESGALRGLAISHRHYNIYPVPGPINSIASGREFPIFMQHFKEGSKFKTTRISSELMH